MPLRDCPKGRPRFGLFMSDHSMLVPVSGLMSPAPPKYRPLCSSRAIGRMAFCGYGSNLRNRITRCGKERIKGVGTEPEGLSDVLFERRSGLLCRALLRHWPHAVRPNIFLNRASCWSKTMSGSRKSITSRNTNGSNLPIWNNLSGNIRPNDFWGPIFMCGFTILPIRRKTTGGIGSSAGWGRLLFCWIPL